MLTQKKNIQVNIEILEYDSGLLDKSVDITYVIIMQNSKNINNVKKQLKIYKPTKKITTVVKITGIPKETVRRKVKNLEKLEFCTCREND